MATYGSSFNPQTQVNALISRGNAAASQVQQLAQQLANQIVAERDAQRASARTGRVYTTLDPAEDILSNNVATVTTGLFSGNTGSLVAMVSASDDSLLSNNILSSLSKSSISSSSPWL